MSIGTILGIIIGIGLFIGSIVMATDNFIVFIDLPSVVMVLGGATAAMFISYEARYVILSLKSIIKIYTAPGINRNMLKSEVGRIIRWGYTVQKSGLPALEAEAGKLKNTDKFLTFGIWLKKSSFIPWASSLLFLRAKASAGTPCPYRIPKVTDLQLYRMRLVTFSSGIL